ncbi:hypothetical protein [Marinobacter sp. F3R08]|uniref:hypothetical protein n=1 Tax=Marinobacter sp. F3R08 TaxID=2841559 RepID=UPI001C092BD7|nr:hypothetical protein [Marinobacter sp. F3R08]MBU2952231.1 hypothetical protein [Marinobacter sp. F3R08]
MRQEASVAEQLTQHISRETKKLNRRSSWITKIMESQWPTYLLPVSRVIEALGLRNRAELEEHTKDLTNMLASALNEYRTRAEKICERSGVMPYEIPDATRYAMYLSGLVDEIATRFECVTTADSIELRARKKAKPEIAKIAAVRSEIYMLICSESLQDYMRETGNEQTIIADAAADCA